MQATRGSRGQGAEGQRAKVSGVQVEGGIRQGGRVPEGKATRRNAGVAREGVSGTQNDRTCTRLGQRERTADRTRDGEGRARGGVDNRVCTQ